MSDIGIFSVCNPGNQHQFVFLIEDDAVISHSQTIRSIKGSFQFFDFSASWIVCERFNSTKDCGCNGPIKLL